MQNRKTKKIVFIVTQSEMGGAQRYVLAASIFFAKEHYEVSVAAGEGDSQLFKELPKSITTAKLNHLKRTSLPLEAIKGVWEIVKLLRREKPDVLFLNSTMAGVLGSKAAFLYKIFSRKPLKIIYRIGGWAFNDPKPQWQKKAILLAEKATAPLKDKIIVNSEFDLQCALKYEIAPKEKFVLIHNGINPKQLKFLPKGESRKALNLSAREMVIGTIANFYKTKGLQYFIEAAGIKTFRQLPAKFIIIGDGPERIKLENLIKEKGLQEKVILFGRISEASRYLKAFDVFVLPSLKEGFPWVILEAMAAGVPVVATKVGALQEIIKNKKSGLLVKPGDSKQLGEAVKKILRDAKLRKNLASEAKKRVKDFSESEMLRKTKWVIEEG